MTIHVLLVRSGYPSDQESYNTAAVLPDIVLFLTRSTSNNTLQFFCLPGTTEAQKCPCTRGRKCRCLRSPAYGLSLGRRAAAPSVPVVRTPSQRKAPRNALRTTTPCALFAPAEVHGRADWRTRTRVTNSRGHANWGDYNREPKTTLPRLGGAYTAVARRKPSFALQRTWHCGHYLCS